MIGLTIEVIATCAFIGILAYSTVVALRSTPHYCRRCKPKR
jgi:hypothetical protein